jgi:ribosomal protein S18 acetylase RimI-like enzyme
LFAVSGELQGKGYGKFLLTEAFKESKYRGSKFAFMWVLECRTELLQWYEKLGFVDSGIKKDFVAQERLLQDGVKFKVIKKIL